MFRNLYINSAIVFILVFNVTFTTFSATKYSVSPAGEEKVVEPLGEDKDTTTTSLKVDYSPLFSYKTPDIEYRRYLVHQHLSSIGLKFSLLPNLDHWADYIRTYEPVLNSVEQFENVLERFRERVLGHGCLGFFLTRPDSGDTTESASVVTCSTHPRVAFLLHLWIHSNSHLFILYLARSSYFLPACSLFPLFALEAQKKITKRAALLPENLRTKSRWLKSPQFEVFTDAEIKEAWGLLYEGLNFATDHTHYKPELD